MARPNTHDSDAVYSNTDEFEEDADVGIRLRNEIDLADLRRGAPIEINLDEDSLKTHSPIIDETSSHYEQSDIYRNSELYTLGEEDANDSDDESSMFDKLRKRMQPITEDGGVMKRILREGYGPTIAELVAQKKLEELKKVESERREFQDDDINIAYHYTGLLEDELEPFDNTYLRDSRPQRAFLNAELLPGVRLALATMREKEVADFLIAPNYAFGSMGCPPRIPKNATLRFKIELCKFWATTELEAYNKLSRNERKNIPVEKLVKLCSVQREAGNKLYENGDFKGASFAYGRALKILEEASLQDDKDEELQQRALLKLYLNKTQCCTKLEQWDQVITYADKALQIDSRSCKALYRKAKAKMEFGDFAVAKSLAKQALTILPTDQSIGNLMSEIARKEQREKQRQKQLFSRMIQSPSVESKQVVNVPSDMLRRVTDQLQQFKDSSFAELKLDSSTYTSQEFDCMVEAAGRMGIKCYPNRTDGEWISLKLSKN